MNTVTNQYPTFRAVFNHPPDDVWSLKSDKPLSDTLIEAATLLLPLLKRATADLERLVGENHGTDS